LKILDGIYTFNELVLRSNQSWLICRMMLAHVSFKETSTWKLNIDFYESLINCLSLKFAFRVWDYRYICFPFVNISFGKLYIFRVSFALIQLIHGHSISNLEKDNPSPFDKNIINWLINYINKIIKIISI